MFLLDEDTPINTKARLFRGFSDPSRLKILESLRNSGQTVGVIVALTGLSQSNVSNHLACLRECGLVSAAQKGKFVEYNLSDPRIDALLSLAESLLTDIARGVYECARYDVKGPSNE